MSDLPKYAFAQLPLTPSEDSLSTIAENVAETPVRGFSRRTAIKRVALTALLGTLGIMLTACSGTDLNGPSNSTGTPADSGSDGSDSNNSSSSSSSSSNNNNDDGNDDDGGDDDNGDDNGSSGSDDGGDDGGDDGD